jgi:type IV pilus assembly protein PilF
VLKLARRLRHAVLVVVLGAAACATTQIRNDPEASEKRTLLGADYFSKGLIGPALEELLKAVELNRDNAEAQHLLGLIFLRKGVEAEEMSIRAQCLKGDELRLEAQDMNGHFKKAEEHFREAVRIKPTYSEALNSLAVVAIHFGRNDEAIKFEERALANIIYREPYIAQGNLGLAYLNMNKLPEAAKALRQALFEQPQFCVGRYRLAKIYYEQKEWDQAADELDKVTGEKQCPIQEAYHLAGLVALRRQDRGRAHEMFQKCVSLAPKSCIAKECTLAQ